MGVVTPVVKEAIGRRYAVVMWSMTSMASEESAFSAVYGEVAGFSAITNWNGRF